MNPYEKYSKENISEFFFDEHKLVLIHYPIWKAYVAANESDIWIEIIPNINIANKVIISPNYKDSSNHSNKKKEKNDDKLYEQSNSINSEKFFLSIPDDIRQNVSQFPDSHWQLVNAILHIGKDFSSLMDTNPAIAYMIANIEKFNPSFLLFSNISVLQRMIRTKRTEILRLCGFPKSQKMVKIFSKIEPQFVNPSDLIELKDILIKQRNRRKRIFELLSHSPKINKNLIYFCNYFGELIPILDNKIIFELIDDEDFLTKSMTLHTIQRKSKKYDIPFPKISSVKKISEIKDRFEEKVRKKVRELDLFPMPPLEDNYFIKAITSESELISWAKRQHNCIRGYANSIRAGRVYLYRVEFYGEEATLELKLRGNKIVKGDLLGFKNQPVSTALSNEVNKWLKNNL